MRLFLDANILVSVLNNEYPQFTFSSRILSLADVRGFRLFTSPICLAIAFYFAEKKSGAGKAKEKMALLARHIETAEVNSQDVRQALNNKQIIDFEDGLEYYAAKRARCQYIISEDSADFYFSDIPVMGAKDYLLGIINQKK